jgi:uncharacterized DUF497 family protein
MTFDWDSANIDHIAEHGVSQDEVEDVFYSRPVALKSETVNGEERTVVIGKTDEGRFLSVVYTVRRQLIRIVTAYPSTAHQIKKWRP